MQVRYIGMFEVVEVPRLSPDPANVVVEVARGEVANVPAGAEQLAIAKGLLIQAENWEPVDEEAKAAQQAAIAEHEARLRARGISPDATVGEAAESGTPGSVFAARTEAEAPAPTRKTGVR